MHIKEAYSVNPNSEKTLFWFTSQGEKGVIYKWVWFQYLDEFKYNLSFGDVNNGKFDDRIISNNQDYIKVISTVARIIHLFFDEYPDVIIEIKGVDKKRQRFYNTIFRRRYEEIIPKFTIFGIIKGKKQVYDPNLNFDKFEIHLKKI